VKCGGSGYVGENWYGGAPDGATFAWVDYNWTKGCSEKAAYWKRSGCSGTTGHYTQVVWAKSVFVGCGWTKKGGIVCNYAPGGNFNGEAPFVQGNTCSNCPGDYRFCVDGLCNLIFLR